MEEEKNAPDEQLDKPLSKEEILERSRKENAKMSDERERKMMSYGVAVSSVAGLVILLILFLVNAIVLKRTSYELIGMVFIMNSINFIWQGIFGRKMKIAFIITGTLQMFAGIGYIIMWAVTLA